MNDLTRKLCKSSMPVLMLAAMPLFAKRFQSIPPESTIWFDAPAKNFTESSPMGNGRLPFALYVRNDNRRPKLVKLIATCGPLDMDGPQPAITVMMPDED
jgi:hypothetical protein